MEQIKMKVFDLPGSLGSALRLPGNRKEEEQVQETYNDIPVVDNNFLLDGKRVDFVLVTIPSTDDEKWKENEKKRRYFERNLHNKKGLLITHVKPTMQKQEWAGYAEIIGSSVFSAIKDRDLKVLARGVKDVVTTAAAPIIEEATEKVLSAMGLEEGAVDTETVGSSVFSAIKDGDLKALVRGAKDVVTTAAEPMIEGAKEKALDAVGLEQGVMGLQQGALGLEQGVVGLQQGALGLEQGAVGLKQGLVGLQQGALGLEQGAIGLEQGGVGLKQGAVGLKQGVMGLGQGVTGLEQDAVGLEQDTDQKSEKKEQEWAGYAGTVGSSVFSAIKDRDFKVLPRGVKDVVTTAAEPVIEGAKEKALNVVALEQGAVGLEQGAEGLEQGVVGLEHGALGLEQSAVGVETSVRSSVFSAFKYRDFKVLARGAKDAVTTAAVPMIEEATGKMRDAAGFEQNEVGREQDAVGLQQDADQKCEKKEKPGMEYTLVHAPWEVLAKCAEGIMLRVPVREPHEQLPTTSRSEGICARIWKRFKTIFTIDNPSVMEEKKYINDFFTRENFDKNLYLFEDKETFFKDIDRSRMVFRIMKSTRFSEKSEDFGIRRMLNENIYDDAYSLHDGDIDISSSGDKPPENNRQRLVNDWASFRRWYKYQPLNAIRSYFGTRVAMYFAWLGTYTMMLISASIVGLICFLIGFLTISGFQPAKDVCNPSNRRAFYMCPLCDKHCSFWSLTSSCQYARYSHVIDYEGTVFFAMFMSFWCVVFLEVWKRKQTSLAFEWDMMHFEEDFEPPRPAFVATVKEQRPNPVTGRVEPYIPRKVRTQRYTIATVAITTMILLALVSVFGVVVYRAIVFAVMSATDNKHLQGNGRIYTSVTSAVLNLLSIGVMSKVYGKLAFALTNWENPRTRTEYQNILTVKMFLFQAVNMYSSFFYIAFFKSSFVTGIPGHYSRIAGVRMEGCDPSGCTMELCIQLAILLGGKQLYGQMQEIFIPTVKRLWNRRSRRKLSDVLSVKDFPSHPQWEMDQLLAEEPEFRMFEEYLEMVLQFGFVTMFVAAFPLAPLLALFNNILEIRGDAINFVVNYRRRTAERAQDIGAWFGVLRAISVASVILNSLVIAFTSEFIPRQVYKYAFSPDGTLTGYMNNSLSYFNVKDLEVKSRPVDPYANLPFNNTYCRFKEYFSPQSPYTFTLQYYYVLAARLAFVLIFNAIVLLTSSLLAWVIPDVPYTLDVKIKREEYLARESLVQSKIRDGTVDPQDADMLLSAPEDEHVPAVEKGLDKGASSLEVLVEPNPEYIREHTEGITNLGYVLFTI